MSSSTKRPSAVAIKAAAVKRLFNAKGWKADPDRVDAYVDLLADIPCETVIEACSSFALDPSPMPNAGELRARCTGQRTIAPEERAALAFGVLSDAVRQVGVYRTIKFDDPAMNATVTNLGGWVAVCDTPDRDWQKFFRRRFESVYATFVRRGVWPDEDVTLLGVSAQTNGGNFDQEDLRKIERATGADCGRPWLYSTGLPEIPRLDHREKGTRSVGALLKLKSPEDVLEAPEALPKDDRVGDEKGAQTS